MSEYRRPTAAVRVPASKRGRLHKVGTVAKLHPNRQGGNNARAGTHARHPVPARVAGAGAGRAALCGVIHVDSPDAQVMTEALHNAANLIETLRREASSVAIAIVANRPGT
jgi:hypothetical protein